MNITDNQGFKMRRLCRFMLWTSAILNALGFVILDMIWSDGYFIRPIHRFISERPALDVLFFNDFWVSPVILVLGILSFVFSLIAIIIIYKRRINEWKIFAVVNLMFGLFFLLYDFIIFGLFLLFIRSFANGPSFL